MSLFNESHEEKAIGAIRYSFDPYETLGVGKEFSDLELRSKWKQKVRKFHPDRGGTNQEMANITQAYEILRDQKKRRLSEAALAATSYEPTSNPSANGVSKWIQGPTCSSARQIRNITSVLQSWSLSHEETHTSTTYDHEFGSSTFSNGAWRGRPPGMVERKEGISKWHLEEDSFARTVVFGDTDEDKIRLKKTKSQHFEVKAFVSKDSVWKIYVVGVNDCVIIKEVVNGEIKRYLVGYLVGGVCIVWDMKRWGIRDFEWALRHQPQDVAMLLEDYLKNDDSDAHSARGVFSVINFARVTP